MPMSTNYSDYVTVTQFVSSVSVVFRMCAVRSGLIWPLTASDICKFETQLAKSKCQNIFNTNFDRSLAFVQ